MSKITNIIQEKEKEIFKLEKEIRFLSNHDKPSCNICTNNSCTNWLMMHECFPEEDLFNCFEYDP